jgi:hypothetical protein
MLVLEAGQSVFREPGPASAALELVPGELLVAALSTVLEELGQRRQPLSRRRAAEEDHGHPGALAVHHHPVAHAPEPPIGQHLHATTVSTDQHRESDGE